MGETEPAVQIKFLGSALDTGHFFPSQSHGLVVPVCFTYHPKVLENSVSASQTNGDGGLEAGRGPFYPFGLTVGEVSGPKKICEAKKKKVSLALKL